MPTITENIVDTGTDLIEKVSSPASRSGSTVERAGKMLEEGVSPAVIALQMTENSPKNQTYTQDDVKTLGKVYLDSKTRVTLTAKQTRALIKDQNEQADVPANAILQS